MSGGPADPWRDGDPADDLINEGELLLRSLASMLDGGDGLEAALSAVRVLDRDDLEELAVYVAFLRIAAIRRDREREEKARERRRRRWRPWTWRPWRRWRWRR
jgi:hypothetical protein